MSFLFGFRAPLLSLTLTVIFWSSACLPVSAALLYKSYIVRYDQGWDVLCDPYVVRKNDWVFKIFRQKGEISKKNYQDFLRIFKRLNPHLTDADHIRPGQRILIPLKRLEQGSLPGQASGVVTIPFVTISKIRDILEAYSEAYQVLKGDYVSKLVAGRFGPYGTDAYHRGFELFKALNPDLTDPDHIYVGQNLRLPDASLQNEAWFSSLFDENGGLRQDGELDVNVALPSLPPPLQAALTTNDSSPAGNPLAETAEALGGKLLNRGTFFFPKTDGRVFKLDLAQFPLIELADGSRLLFTRGNDIKPHDLAVVQSHWKNVKVIDAPADASMETLLSSALGDAPESQIKPPDSISFSDRGVTVTVQAQWIKPNSGKNDSVQRYLCITIIKNNAERTPETIARYLDQHGFVLKEILQAPSDQEFTASDTAEQTDWLEDVAILTPVNRKAFVLDFLGAMGYRYAPNVSISFPYAGVQVTALSNLLVTPGGKEILVDFEDLYGEAVKAIEKSGLEVLQVKREQSLHDILLMFLDRLKITYTIDPTFLAANRAADYNTFINISGFLTATENQDKILLAAVPLHKGVVRFFNARNVKVVMTGAAGATGP